MNSPKRPWISPEHVHTMVGHLILPWRRAGTTKAWYEDRKHKLADLIARRLLVYDPCSETGWSLTEKGRVYTGMMLDTPEPVLRETWIDPRVDTLRVTEGNDEYADVPLSYTQKETRRERMLGRIRERRRHRPEYLRRPTDAPGRGRHADADA